MNLTKAITILEDSKDYLPAKSIEAVNYVCGLALQNEYNEKQNYYLKKQVDILSRKLAKQLNVSISTIRGRMLWEIEESEKQ